MDIRVSGHQVEVGDALRGHATDALKAADEKYHMRATSAQVTFGKGPHDHGFTCEIVAYAPPGLVLKAIERAADARPAFEAAPAPITIEVRPPRAHAPSEEELAAHAHFLTGITDPIWVRLEGR